MGFVDLFGSDEGAEERPEPEPREHRRPEWFGPPEDELGVAVPLGVIVARSASGVVAVSHAEAFSTGIAFSVVAQARGLRQSQANRMMHDQHLGFMGDLEELPDSFLRFGIELADGARVSNVGGRRAMLGGDEPPKGPLLMHSGGGGGNAGGGAVSVRPGYWLWPLPPAGALHLSCEWPAVDISLATIEIDGTQLLAAAERVVKLWG
jgi:hypothetical protein